jgi:hypothetical protein
MAARRGSRAIFLYSRRGTSGHLERLVLTTREASSDSGPKWWLAEAGSSPFGKLARRQEHIEVRDLFFFQALKLRGRDINRLIVLGAGLLQPRFPSSGAATVAGDHAAPRRGAWPCGRDLFGNSRWRGSRKSTPEGEGFRLTGSCAWASLTAQFVILNGRASYPPVQPVASWAYVGAIQRGSIPLACSMGMDLALVDPGSPEAEVRSTTRHATRPCSMRRKYHPGRRSGVVRL